MVKKSAPPMSDPLPPNRVGKYVVVKLAPEENKTEAYLTARLSTATSIRQQHEELGEGYYAIAQMIPDNPSILAKFLRLLLARIEY